MEKNTHPGGSERRWSLAPRGKPGLGAGTSAHGPGSDEQRRGQSERRVVYDRRQLIRFEDDRRTGVERRMGSDPWAFP